MYYLTRSHHAPHYLFIGISFLLSACGGGGGGESTAPVANNTAPKITSTASFSVEENLTAIATVSASDAEGDVLSYSLSGTVDDGLFMIDTSTGALSFAVAPNFESPQDTGSDNIYDIQVTVSDGVLSSSQSIAVTVTNVNDIAPVLSPTAMVAIQENNTAVITVTATDPEGDALAYNISGGVDAARFSLDAVSGDLSFLAAPNFEGPSDSDGNNTYLLELTVSDGLYSVMQSMTVTVNNVNDIAPVFTSVTTASLTENTTSVMTVAATDGDGDVLSYSLSGGADAALFSLDSASGSLNFLVAPDFENPADSDGNNVYLVEVIANDGMHGIIQALTVSVNNVNDTGPVFSSAASTTMSENTTAVMSVAATDADGDTLSYSLSGGADAALFSLNSVSGILSFNTAPDFENPVDSDANNDYLLEVTVSDGIHSALQPMTVTINNANDIVPVFTSATSATLLENNTVVMTVAAADGDGDSLSYTLTGGLDVGRFSLNTASGSLSFNTAPDYELPADSDSNNSYLLEVTVSDGLHNVVQALTVDVTNKLEMAVADGGVKNLSLTWDDIGADYYKVLMDPDGASGFTQINGDLFATTTDYTMAVHATDWVNARFMVEGYTAGNVLIDSSPSINITSVMLGSIGYIKASNTDAADGFGLGVALSGDGNTLAVSATREASAATGINGNQNDNTAAYSGAVYIYRRSGASWSQQAYIKASNTQSNDGFGARVALSSDGNTLTVSAQDEDSCAVGINGNQADNNCASSGAVYLYRFSAGNWSQQAYIKASNTVLSDRFGYSAALDSAGNTLAVGAINEGGSGAVYLYRYNGTSWIQQAYIKASNAHAGALFGSAVDLSSDGNTLAVGSEREFSKATGIDGDQTDVSAYGSGAVYLFAYDAGTASWSQTAYIKASNTEASDYFGNAVALNSDGTTLAVGAGGEDSSDVGVDGDQLNNSALSSGAVYLFRKGAGGWAQQAYIKAHNTDASDSFGGGALALGADGNTLVVGAAREASNADGINGNSNDNSLTTGAGAAYLYKYDGISWVPAAYIKAPNSDDGDYFGYYGLSMSDDAFTLAIGAINEDGASIGIDGNLADNSSNASGAVYLY